VILSHAWLTPASLIYRTGSARGDLSVDVGRNIIHGSDGPESAAHEISFWFSDAELINWQPAASKWIYEKP